MPYRYEKQGDKYVVYKKDSGKRVGATAGNKEALKRYLAALHMHENDELGVQSYEGSMAKSDAALAAQYAYALHKMIQRDIDLPEWIEAKITKAKYDLQVAAEYMYAELKGLSEDLSADQKKYMDMKKKIASQEEDAAALAARIAKQKAANAKKGF